jgi:hypothetical protein
VPGDGAKPGARGELLEVRGVKPTRTVPEIFELTFATQEAATEGPMSSSEPVPEVTAPPKEFNVTVGELNQTQLRRDAGPIIKTGSQVIAEFREADNHPLGCNCDKCSAQIPNYATHPIAVADLKEFRRKETA